jgi:hypothetical protein
MGRKSVSERTKERYQKSISKLMDGLSRPVIVYKTSAKNYCNNCFFDSLTNKSTGKCKWTAVEALERQEAWVSEGNSNTMYKYFLKGRCPVCGGLGYIETLRKKYVKGVVNWAPSNEIVQLPAGLAGSTTVLIKTDPSYLELFKCCEKAVVDGIDCVLATPPMLRGIGEVAVLFVLMYTIKTINPDSSDGTIKGYYDQ